MQCIIRDPDKSGDIQYFEGVCMSDLMNGNFKGDFLFTNEKEKAHIFSSKSDARTMIKKIGGGEIEEV